MSRHWLYRLTLAISGAAAIVGCVQRHAAQPAQRLEAVQRDAQWARAFTRSDGWTNGDIGHSLPIPGGRTLWLFGDSFAGPVRDGKHVPGESTMVRGAIAWHETPAPGEPPRDIQFALAEPWGGVAEATWARPPAGLWPEGTWYWLMGDGAVITDAEDRQRLVLFVTALGPSGNPEGMWNFRRIGGAILIVENPQDPPPQWRLEQRVNPLVEPVPLPGRSGTASPEASPRGEEKPWQTDDWGAAVVSGETAENGRRRAGPAVDRAPVVYVYGVRSHADGHQSLLVARCEEQSLHRPDSWRFYDGGEWAENASDAAPVAGGVLDEFTVQKVERNGEVMLVLIQSEPFLGQRIFARTARRPEGPWSERKVIYEVAEPATDPRLMTYAAKGHAHLSRPGELLVSYIINSTDFAQVVNDASLYRPRFIRVPLEMLPPPPEPGQ